MFDGRGWQGEWQGCLKGGCSCRGWQGKMLRGALKGGDFLQGCLNVGSIFAWVVEGGEF